LRETGHDGSDKIQCGVGNADGATRTCGEKLVGLWSANSGGVIEETTVVTNTGFNVIGVYASGNVQEVLVTTGEKQLLFARHFCRSVDILLQKGFLIEFGALCR
jgi:hypothetical protein